MDDGSFSFELEDDAFGSALIDFAVEVSAGPPRDKRCTPVNRSERASHLLSQRITLAIIATVR